MEPRHKPDAARISYAQSGEDLLIERLLGRRAKATDGFYIDVGCFDPIRSSNTYLFYERGWSGICIDPNPDVAERFATLRPRDVFVNAGVGATRDSLEYHRFNRPVFNTFDGEAANRVVQSGRVKPRDRLSVAVLPLRDIIQQHAPNRSVDILSVDVEGRDLDVLRSADLEQLRPALICCETRSNPARMKNDPIVIYLQGLGYKVAAHTGKDAIMVASSQR